ESTAARQRTNPTTGELETATFENGRLKRSATSRRITEMVYDDRGFETGSDTRAVNGTPVERTQTVEVWPDRTKDPYAPRLAKLRINFVTGEIKREIYGAFAQPTIVVDDQFITTNSYAGTGEYRSSVIFENGSTDDEYQRQLWTRILSPVSGRQRFTLTAQQLTNRVTEVRRLDSVKGLEKIVHRDGFGRKTR